MELNEIIETSLVINNGIVNDPNQRCSNTSARSSLANHHHHHQPHQPNHNQMSLVDNKINQKFITSLNTNEQYVNYTIGNIYQNTVNNQVI